MAFNEPLLRNTVKNWECLKLGAIQNLAPIITYMYCPSILIKGPVIFTTILYSQNHSYITLTYDLGFKSLIACDL